MPINEIYKKILTSAIAIALVIIALVSISILEDWGHVYAVEHLSFVLDEKGHLVPLTGSQAPQMMTAAGVELIENLIRIFKIILWMVLVIVIVRLVARLIFGSVLRKTAQTEIVSLIKTVLSIIVYIVAFFIIFQSQYPSVQLAPLFTGSAILGIVVGLALQDTLGNLFAGIALQADQLFQVGDVISISNRGTGIVESVSWRGVKIRTFQGKLLVISNASLGKETIEVAPKNNENARLVNFTTSYSCSPATTIQVVRDAVRQVENVSPKRRPVVRICNFGESAIEWEVKYWIEDYGRFNDTDAIIRQRIWYAFKRDGITFPFPTRNIRIEPRAQKIEPEEQINAVAEILSHVPIFAPLSEEEIGRLAKAASRRVYAPGEVIVRKGQEGGSMFVIVRGAVSVQLPSPSGPLTLRNLKANDFFGEMSLLTGEPRTANVVAEEETEVLQIRKAALKPLFEDNPELLRIVSEIVEERRSLLPEAVAEAEQIKTEEQIGLMGTIRRFFGLK